MTRSVARLIEARRWTTAGCAAFGVAVWIGACSVGGMPNRSAARYAPAVEFVQAAGTAGAASYGQYCAVCHQANGKGTSGAFPALAGSAVVTGEPHYLARVVLYGLRGRITAGGQTYNSTMSGFAKSMNDGQIAQLLTYIRSSWGNNAPAVDEDVVKAERAIPGTPDDNGAKYPK